MIKIGNALIRQQAAHHGIMTQTPQA